MAQYPRMLHPVGYAVSGWWITGRLRKTIGLIVVLDNRCRKLWTKRLANATTVMKCVTPKSSDTPWVVIGCEDGMVIILDGRGEVIRSGRMHGRPVCIDEFAASSVGSMVLLPQTKNSSAGS